jgi:hypothetical protein
MRCPKYSSSDEEPDYYADCGAEIHRFGALTHMRSLGLEVDEGELAALQKRIPQEDLQDFLSRRANNLIYNQKAIDLRKEGIIDCLVIPQDDSAPYGYTAIDQTVVRDHISDVGLTAQVLMYPGADEVGLTLLTRCVLAFAHKKPKVYVKYAAEHADGIIPSYEDRPLGETVKYHILAAGGRKVDSYRDADCVLCFTANSRGMSEAKYQAKHTVEYDCFRNLPELIDFIKDAVQDGKPVILADNAYANGGDLQLLKCLQSEGLLDKLAAYAGWNTNANTLGTALAQGLLYLLEGGTASHYNFLALRYLEDLGYCSKVRFAVTANELEKRGFNYFWVQDRRGEIAAIVKAQLEKFLHEELPSLEGQIAIKDVYMPWRRMFEVGIDAEWWRGEKV